MSRPSTSGFRLPVARPSKQPRQVDPVLTQRGVEAFIKLLSTAIVLDKQDDLEDQQLGCAHTNKSDWTRSRRADECGMTLIMKMKKFQWLAKTGYITPDQMQKLEHLAELFEPRHKQLISVNYDRRMHQQQAKLQKHHATQQEHKSTEMLQAYHKQLEQLQALQLQSANAVMRMTPPMTPPNAQTSNHSAMHDYFSLVPRSYMGPGRSPSTPLSGTVGSGSFPTPSTPTTSSSIVDLCAQPAAPAFSFAASATPPTTSFPFSFACALPSPPLSSDSAQQTSYFSSDYTSFSAVGGAPAFQNDPAPGYGYPPATTATTLPKLSLAGEACFGPLQFGGSGWDMSSEAMQVDMSGMTPAVEKDGFDFGTYLNMPED